MVGLTLVIVSVKREVLVRVSVKREVLVINTDKCEVLVIVCVSVTVDVWVVGVALAQKLLKNRSTSCSH